MLNRIRTNPLKYLKIGTIAFLISDLFQEALSILNYGASSARDLLMYAVYAAAPILFLVYLFVGYPKNKSHVLLPISCIVHSAYFLWICIKNRDMLSMLVSRGSVVWIPHNIWSLLNLWLYVFLFFYWVLVVFAFAAHALNGFTKFKYLRVSRILGVLPFACKAMYAVCNLFFGHSGYSLLTNLLTLFGALVSAAVWFIFWFWGVSALPAAATANPRLYALWQQLERGEITAEEYDRRRNEPTYPYQ